MTAKSDGDSKPAETGGDGQASTAAGTALEMAAAALPVEVVKAVTEARAPINVNVLIEHVTVNAGSPEKALANVAQALELAKKWEDHNLNVFKERAQAVISIKERDPDEIDKRRNNRIRRMLKCVLAGAGVVSMVGMLGTVLAAGPLMAALLSGLIGAVCLAMLAPLASGESVSSTDVVRVITAFTQSLKHDSEHKDSSQPQANSGHKNRKKKR